MSGDWQSGAAYVAGGRQPIAVPSLYADSYAVRKQLLLGDEAPSVRGRMQMTHGRFLGGLGGESPDGEVGYDPRYQDLATDDLEAQDDVYGSGVFDAGGRQATSNANMGVFASHYSLPGYLARDVPFTVSQDVSDIQQGTDVVSVPAGGMSYIEERGRLQRPAVLGPTWQPKAMTPAGVTRRDQPYAFLNRPGQPPSPPLNPGAPSAPPPARQPSRLSGQWVEQVPQDHKTCALPSRPAQRVLPRKMIVQPQRSGIAVRPPGSCAGLGQEDDDKKPASAGQLVFAGAVAGAAAGVLMAVVSGKKKGRRR